MASASLERCLRFILDEDATAATLKLDPGYATDDATPEGLLAYLDSKTVSHQAIDRAAVDALAAAAQHDPESPHEAVVARGTAPIHGEDARFDYVPRIRDELEAIERRRAAARKRNPAAVEIRVDGPDGERIDFYNQSAFVIVRARDPIGRIKPPTDGTDGLDIFGNAIPSKRGKNPDIRIGSGLNKGNDDQIIATAGGRLISDISSIQVETELDIQGYVDFSTGNVRFPGPVTVRKGVRDRFEIHAEGPVRIFDLVEAATIQTSASLTLDGGMAGREQGQVRIEGDVTARYLDGVNGFVRGELRIDRELSSCSLDIGGRLECPSLTVRGGRLRCGQRVDIAQLGGEGGLPTDLFIGALPHLDEVAANLAPLEDDIKARVEQLNRDLGVIQTKIDAKAAKPADLERMTECQYMLAELDQRAASIELALERAAALYATRALTSLTIRRAIHPGSRIFFRGYRAEPETIVRGPIVIDLGPDGVPQYIPHKSDAEPVPLKQLCRVIQDRTLVPLPAPKTTPAKTLSTTDQTGDLPQAA